ncbi:MAG TPA: choice-of-anchor Q domain-containing protein, partial [Vicinamibacterales bacterium]|nr:choice-of-anchor Q domain-containing protein [Vicinamibacterales bacterium]
NSTVANNSCSSKRAADDCGCFGGGGIYNVIGTVRIDNSTIAGNSSFPSGGSITSLYGPTTLSRTILAKGPTGPNCYYTNILGGRIVSDGYNISDDASCSSVLTGPGDLNETSAGLSPSGLQNNGGATETIQLLSTSAVVDSVPLEACAVSDQRGVTRPQGAACDVGAYERVPSPYTAGIQQPIKVDGTTTFSANRGVVPVKFALSYNGSPTCQLPPAAISLVQTAGPATGPLDDGAYLMPADVGASFRIDVGSCQYVYNLGTDALSTGTYAVSISIDGLVIGTATFGIR